MFAANHKVTCRKRKGTNCWFIQLLLFAFADGGRQTKAAASSGAVESGGSGFDNPCFDSGKFILFSLLFSSWGWRGSNFLSVGKTKYSIVHRPLARRRSRRIARDDRRANRVNNLTENWQTFGVNGLVSFPPPPPRMNERTNHWPVVAAAGPIV